MKKEKQVRTYQRKTKSGKVVVVRAHKAKYDAAEDLKESITKKKGSGLEMESLKNEGVENPFSVEMDDFKEWYAFNDWDIPKKEWPVAVRRVDKALVSGMGKKSYDDFCTKVDESWTARGYRRAMKDLSALSKSPVAKQSVSDAAKSRRAINISDEVDANGSKSYSKEEGSAMLKRIQKAGFNKYMQSVFYDGYKFNDPETGDTLWMNVSTDKRGRMHFDTMHPLDRDEHYNYYEKEREAEKKRDAQRMRERNVKPQKLTLDEFLGLRGLSAPISNFMMDKLRLPHGLTQRGWKRLYKDADKANDEYHTKREAAIKEYKKLVKEGKIVPPTTMERLERNAKGHPDNASTQAAKRVLEKRAARMAKKLPKGSFITVDENGNEIPGAPKHGTKFKADKLMDKVFSSLDMSTGSAKGIFGVGRAKLYDSKGNVIGTTLDTPNAVAHAMANDKRIAFSSGILGEKSRSELKDRFSYTKDDAKLGSHWNNTIKAKRK